MNEYEVFTRNWWKENPKFPNGLEPNPSARKTHIAFFGTEEEARAFCQDGNKNRPKSWERLSRKYEYTEV